MHVCTLRCTLPCTYYKDRYVFYWQFTIKLFQIYFLISVNEVIFTVIYNFFLKTYISIYLGARFFMHVFSCTLLMSWVHGRCTLTTVYFIFGALLNRVYWVSTGWEFIQPWWDEQIFAECWDSPHPSSRENHAS